MRQQSSTAKKLVVQSQHLVLSNWDMKGTTQGYLVTSIKQKPTPS